MLEVHPNITLRDETLPLLRCFTERLAMHILEWSKANDPAKYHQLPSQYANLDDQPANVAKSTPILESHPHPQSLHGAPPMLHSSHGQSGVCFCHHCGHRVYELVYQCLEGKCGFLIHPTCLIASGGVDPTPTAPLPNTNLAAECEIRAVDAGSRIEFSLGPRAKLMCWLMDRTERLRYKAVTSESDAKLIIVSEQSLAAWIDMRKRKRVSTGVPPSTWQLSKSERRGVRAIFDFLLCELMDIAGSATADRARKSMKALDLATSVVKDDEMSALMGELQVSFLMPANHAPTVSSACWSTTPNDLIKIPPTLSFPPALPAAGTNGRGV